VSKRGGRLQGWRLGITDGLNSYKKKYFEFEILAKKLEIKCESNLQLREHFKLYISFFGSNW
jgi:hypothetical protein